MLYHFFRVCSNFGDISKKRVKNTKTQKIFFPLNFNFSEIRPFKLAKLVGCIENAYMKGIAEGLGSILVRGVNRGLFSLIFSWKKLGTDLIFIISHLIFMLDTFFLFERSKQIL